MIASVNSIGTTITLSYPYFAPIAHNIAEMNVSFTFTKIGFPQNINI